MNSKTPQMITSVGNAKLGKNIAVFSRKSQDSCPTSCIHHEDRNGTCYALKIEKRFPNAAKAYTNNLQVKDWQQYRSFFLNAAKKKRAVRMHVSGDFLKTLNDGSKVLDEEYLEALKKAIGSIDEDKKPQIWLYTHVLDGKIASLQSSKCNVYASVDSEEDYNKAKKAGFKLFAFTTEFRKGKEKSKTVQMYGEKIPVCPEQIGTRDSCESCQLCIKGLTSIAFLNH